MFTGEDRLSLSEDLKLLFGSPHYHTPNKNQLWKDLVDTWKIDDNFSSDYLTDYSNNYAGITTAWIDRYTTSVYTNSSLPEV